MDPITMSLLGLVGNSIGNFQNVGASFGGSALQYQLQKGLNSQAFKYQSRLLQRQMDFAERMSNTAHQREVKDLRKAGLNPILSATGGNGAASPVVSAPGVSSGSAQAVRFEPSTVVDAIGTLAGIQNTAQQTRNLRTTEDLVKAQIATEASKQQLNKANATKALADSSTIMNLPGKALDIFDKRSEDIADGILSFAKVVDSFPRKVQGRIDKVVDRLFNLLPSGPAKPALDFIRRLPGDFVVDRVSNLQGYGQKFVRSILSKFLNSATPKKK